MHRIQFLVVFCALFVSRGPCLGERLTPEKLWDLARVGDAAVSPDGKRLAYLVTRYDLKANEGTTSLMLQSLPDGDLPTGGNKSVAFETPLAAATATAKLKDIKGLGSLGWLNHSSGPKLIYIAPAKDKQENSDKDARGETDGEKKKQEDEKDNEDEGKPQAWMLDPTEGEPKQLTHVKEGVANLKASPSGDAIAFTVDVKMDDKVTELYEDLPKADARIIDSLMYRHWNQWHDYAYSHVHVASIDDQGAASEPIDLMAQLKADCPLPPFGGSEQFAFSPDGQQIALTIKLVNNPAESTDSGIYLAATTGGPLKSITPGMPGYDMDPVYSPDGRFIAFHSMERAGFESDRNRIMLYERSSGQIQEVTDGLDQTTHHATWADDSKSLFFHSETHGTTQVYRIDVDGAELQQISSGRFDFALVSTIPHSNRVLVRQQNMLRPIELAVLDAETRQLATITDVNGKLYREARVAQGRGADSLRRPTGSQSTTG